MRIEGLESIALAAAAVRTPEDVLARIVAGLVDDAGAALARIWLTGLGDICAQCPMRTRCPDQTLCMHLAASAGRPQSGAPEAWSSLEGAHRRYPLGAGKIGRIAATGAPLLIADTGKDDASIDDPEWVRKEGIRGFAGHALLFRDEVMGVLGVFARTPIDARGFDALRSFAAQCGVAIANARAFQELTRARAQLALERSDLRAEASALRGPDALTGTSTALRAVLEQIELIAPTDGNVLILGEPGTGKARVAQAIHEKSGRAGAAFVRVDCAGLATETLERALFGRRRGYDGAPHDEAGRLEIADGGTLFLDEVGALPASLQGRLVRVLRDGTFERLGDTEPRSTDVRVVASSNRDLRAEIAAGRFREDLYYRLAVLPIDVPPLRHRRDDVAPLAAAFLAAAAARLGDPGLALSPADVQRLEREAWPGNVRELAGVVERAALLARGGPIDLDAVLPRAPSTHAADAVGAIETEAQRKQRERANIEAALLASAGRIYGSGGAAELLGMKATTLASRIKALGIRRRR
jgi:transcriptional regulator with GAF, ATPase, and Fis domain